MFVGLLFVLCVGAYALGSVPIHRAFGLSDIDQRGAANFRCRALTRVLLNILKGLAVVEIGSLLGPTGAFVALYGVCLGHNYPVWRRFRGGTGLGVILGGCIALEPTLGLICLVSWILVYYAFMNKTVAAVTSALATPFAAGIYCPECPPAALYPVTFLTLWRHRHRLFEMHMSGPPETEDPFRHL